MNGDRIAQAGAGSHPVGGQQRERVASGRSWAAAKGAGLRIQSDARWQSSGVECESWSWEPRRGCAYRDWHADETALWHLVDTHGRADADLNAERVGRTRTVGVSGGHNKAEVTGGGRDAGDLTSGGIQREAVWK